MVSETSIDILHDIAGSLEAVGPISVGTMFRSPGLRSSGRIVAFLGKGDRLIVKLPKARAVELTDRGDAQAVTMGTRTMREWVSIPAGEDRAATLERWLSVTHESLVFVSSLEDAEH